MRKESDPPFRNNRAAITVVASKADVPVSPKQEELLTELNKLLCPDASLAEGGVWLLPVHPDVADVAAKARKARKAHKSQKQQSTENGSPHTPATSHFETHLAATLTQSYLEQLLQRQNLYQLIENVRLKANASKSEANHVTWAHIRAAERYRILQRQLSSDSLYYLEWKPSQTMQTLHVQQAEVMAKADQINRARANIQQEANSIRSAVGTARLNYALSVLSLIQSECRDKLCFYEPLQLSVFLREIEALRSPASLFLMHRSAASATTTTATAPTGVSFVDWASTCLLTTHGDTLVSTDQIDREQPLVLPHTTQGMAKIIDGLLGTNTTTAYNSKAAFPQQSQQQQQQGSASLAYLWPVDIRLLRYYATKANQVDTESRLSHEILAQTFSSPDQAIMYRERMLPDSPNLRKSRRDTSFIPQFTTVYPNISSLQSYFYQDALEFVHPLIDQVASAPTFTTTRPQNVSSSSSSSSIATTAAATTATSSSSSSSTPSATKTPGQVSKTSSLGDETSAKIDALLDENIEGESRAVQRELKSAATTGNAARAQAKALGILGTSVRELIASVLTLHAHKLRSKTIHPPSNFYSPERLDESRASVMGSSTKDMSKPLTPQLVTAHLDHFSQREGGYNTLSCATTYNSLLAIVIGDAFLDRGFEDCFQLGAHYMFPSQQALQATASEFISSMLADLVPKKISRHTAASMTEVTKLSHLLDFEFKDPRTISTALRITDADNALSWLGDSIMRVSIASQDSIHGAQHGRLRESIQRHEAALAWCSNELLCDEDGHLPRNMSSHTSSTARSNTFSAVARIYAVTSVVFATEGMHRALEFLTRVFSVYNKHIETMTITSQKRDQMYKTLISLLKPQSGVSNDNTNVRNK